MARLMSVALTEDQVRARTKTVTRRLGWRFLWPGDQVQLVRKGMGLKKGDQPVRIAMVEIVSVRRERLDEITQDEVDLEGFGHLTPLGFVEFFCEHMRCDSSTEVTRIEWRYLHTFRIEREVGSIDASVICSCGWECFIQPGPPIRGEREYVERVILRRSHPEALVT